MTPLPTTTNPVLVGEVLDHLAARDRPASTTDVGMRVTTTMRRLVDRGVVTNEDVMTWNANEGRLYWEVSAATVVAILAKREDVVMTGLAHSTIGGRREKHWALKTNVERWGRERAVREAALVEADTRYAIHEGNTFGRGWVRVADTDRYGKVSTPEEAAVATFDTDALGLALALDLANKVKRALVRQAVA